MSEKEKAKSEIQILRDAFEGMKGRQPRSDQELNEWLATDEGKEATQSVEAQLGPQSTLRGWGEVTSKLCGLVADTTCTLDFLTRRMSLLEGASATPS